MIRTVRYVKAFSPSLAGDMVLCFVGPRKLFMQYLHRRQRRHNKGIVYVQHFTRLVGDNGKETTFQDSQTVLPGGSNHPPKQ